MHTITAREARALAQENGASNPARHIIGTINRKIRSEASSGNRKVHPFKIVLKFHNTQMTELEEREIQNYYLSLGYTWTRSNHEDRLSTELSW